MFKRTLFVALTLSVTLFTVSGGVIPSVKRGPIDMIGVLDEFLSPETMYTVRPVLRLSQDAVHGTVKGFVGVDMAQPFYCLGDGIVNWWASMKTLLQYLLTFDPDALANVFDLALPLIEKCHSLNAIGGLGAASLTLFKEDIVSWTKTNSYQMPVLLTLSGYLGV